MKPPPNFNDIARLYRWMELVTFGPLLGRCRCAFLDEMRKSRNALILGDGDGRFTARLLKENPIVLVDALDVSKAMLLTLIRNAGSFSGRVRVHLADARLWEPLNPSFDLIVTHFFLDCLTTEEVISLATRMRSSVTASAVWVVSDFAIPEGLFGWIVARPLITGLYMIFWLLTGMHVHRLPKYREALTEAGFILADQRQILGGLLVSEVWKPEPKTGGWPRARAIS